MEKTRHRVNAKAFVEHYRAGMSFEDLMKTHRLNQFSLDKLTEVLVRKGFLDPSEVAARESLHSTGAQVSEPTTGEDGNPALRNRSSKPADAAADAEDSLCPQCKAQVSIKSLICPECGHVLPGAERWARVEPAKSWSERIPPKILGIFIALPLAALLFFLFRDIFIPAAEDMIDRRSGALRKKISQHREPVETSVILPSEESGQALEEEIHRLVASDILSRADSEYRRLVVGLAWFGLGPEEKGHHLSNIRDLMTRGGLEVNFEVVDFWGQRVARVTSRHIDLSSREETASTDGPAHKQELHPKAPLWTQEVIQAPPRDAVPASRPTK